MTKTRREFLHSLTTLAAIGFLPRSLHAAARQNAHHFAHRRLRGGTYMIGDLTSGGNVLAIPSEAGPIMIDAKHAHTATMLAEDLHRLMDERVAMIINTHHHADHTGGNWKHTRSAKVIAHKNLNPRIEGNMRQYTQQAQNYITTLRNADADERDIEQAVALADQIKDFKPEQFKATQDLPDGHTTLEHGNVELHCHHYGNGHTDNDIVVLFPQHNILHMGDLLFHNVHPFIDRSAKANTIGWQKSVRKAMELADDDTIVIPGHGEITDTTALPKQIEYFDRLREIVSEAIDEGKSRDEVTALQPDAFKDYGFDFLRPIALGGMYDELQSANKEMNP